MLGLSKDEKRDKAGLIITLRKILLKPSRSPPLNSYGIIFSPESSGTSLTCSMSYFNLPFNFIYHAFIETFANHTSQPPPPAWLTQALAAAQTRYPQDSFETMMKHTSIDVYTDAPVPAPPPGQPSPNIRWMYLPRIRCHDCPGKLYTPGPLMTVENFEVHLKNRAHRDRVSARVGTGQ